MVIWDENVKILPQELAPEKQGKPQSAKTFWFSRFSCFALFSLREIANYRIASLRRKFKSRFFFKKSNFAPRRAPILKIVLTKQVFLTQCRKSTFFLNIKVSVCKNRWEKEVWQVKKYDSVETKLKVFIENRMPCLKKRK